MNEAAQQQRISTDTPARNNGAAVSISPEEFIRKIRKIFGRYPDFSGGCLKFHLLLKDIYGGDAVKGWYDGEHIISEVKGKFYDIDGAVSAASMTMDCVLKFRPLTKEDLIAFREVYRAEKEN